MSDNETIKKVLEGDKDCFKDLVDTYAQKIFAYLYRFLGNNKDDAEDLTQEVFIKAYQKLNSFDLEKPFSPWLYRIAHNEAVNFIKKAFRKYEVHLEEDHWNNIPAPNDNIERMLDQEKQNELLQLGLSKLKPKFRQVLILHYFEEKSYEEIAEIIGKPRNSVGTLIMRGKKYLKKYLKMK